MNVVRSSHSQLTPIESAPETYVEAFRCHCFELIHTGYGRLVPKSLRYEEEPAVTGELVKSIQEAMDISGGPEWMESFAVSENVPLNVEGRIGKRRPVVDIQFTLNNSRPRSRYELEAKWVGTEKLSLGNKRGYLGDEGIGCFLSGKYPVKIGHAGMLGYVHSDDEATWAKKIEKHLRAKSEELKIEEFNGRVWQRDNTQQGFHAYISVHDCQASVGRLKITHLLLRFC